MGAEIAAGWLASIADTVSLVRDALSLPESGTQNGDAANLLTQVSAVLKDRRDSDPLPLDRLEQYAVALDQITQKAASAHVRESGAALLTINKSGNASTLDVVSRIRQAMPRVLSTVPSSLKVSLISDQSIFVRESVQTVVREAVIASDCGSRDRSCRAMPTCSAS